MSYLGLGLKEASGYQDAVAKGRKQEFEDYKREIETKKLGFEDLKMDLHGPLMMDKALYDAAGAAYIGDVTSVESDIKTLFDQVKGSLTDAEKDLIGNEKDPNRIRQQLLRKKRRIERMAPGRGPAGDFEEGTVTKIGEFPRERYVQQVLNPEQQTTQGAVQEPIDEGFNWFKYEPIRSSKDYSQDPFADRRTLDLMDPEGLTEEELAQRDAELDEASTMGALGRNIVRTVAMPVAAIGAGAKMGWDWLKDVSTPTDRDLVDPRIAEASRRQPQSLKDFYGDRPEAMSLERLKLQKAKIDAIAVAGKKGIDASMKLIEEDGKRRRARDQNDLDAMAQIQSEINTGIKAEATKSGSASANRNYRAEQMQKAMEKFAERYEGKYPETNSVASKRIVDQYTAALRKGFSEEALWLFDKFPKVFENSGIPRGQWKQKSIGKKPKPSGLSKPKSKSPGKTKETTRIRNGVTEKLIYNQWYKPSADGKGWQKVK